MSDELLITAQGVEIIRRKSQSKLRQTLARIDELVGEYKVEKIVLGYPKNMNNTEGDRCEKTKEFKEMLEKRCGLPVILWDERLTTVAADQSMMEMGIRRENRKEYCMEKINFIDPDTNEVVEFAVEEETQLNGIKYLLVSDGIESGDSEAYILKEITTQDEEVLYEMVDDDVEFAAIAKVFAELADEETQLLF